MNQVATIRRSLVMSMALSLLFSCSEGDAKGSGSSGVSGSKADEGVQPRAGTLTTSAQAGSPGSADSSDKGETDRGGPLPANSSMGSAGGGEDGGGQPQSNAAEDAGGGEATGAGGDGEATGAGGDGEVGAEPGEQPILQPRPPSQNAPNVIVTGPITSGMGRPFSRIPKDSLDLVDYGYIEEEFFFEGSAGDYSLRGEYTPDGMWTALPNSKAGYKSRLLVRRPQDLAQFNGTVVVEWLNVTSGADADVGYFYTQAELLREGYVWVGAILDEHGNVLECRTA